MLSIWMIPWQLVQLVWIKIKKCIETTSLRTYHVPMDYMAGFTFKYGHKKNAIKELRLWHFIPREYFCVPPTPSPPFFCLVFVYDPCTFICILRSVIHSYQRKKKKRFNNIVIFLMAWANHPLLLEVLGNAWSGTKG